MLLFLHDESLDKKVFYSFSVEFSELFKNVVEIEKSDVEKTPKTVWRALSQSVDCFGSRIIGSACWASLTKKQNRNPKYLETMMKAIKEMIAKVVSAGDELDF